MQPQEALLEAKRKLLEIYLRGEGEYASSDSDQDYSAPYGRNSIPLLGARTTLDSGTDIGRYNAPLQRVRHS